MKIIRFDEISSTNDEAMRGNYSHGSVITAQCQTAGRGQRGNSWESRKGENLMFSLVIEPCHIPVVEQYRISMMAALAASDALRDVGVDCVIKWSNDLYVADRKIGGILIEHTLMGEMLTKSVIGIGINVSQTDFPNNLPNPTSLSAEGVSDVTPEKLLDVFNKHFEERYSQNVEVLHADYMSRLWRRTGYYAFSDSDGVFNGAIEAVDPLTGQLHVVKENGEKRSYWFKEVEFLL